jgi:hypothetical protein
MVRFTCDIVSRYDVTYDAVRATGKSIRWCTFRSYRIRHRTSTYDIAVIIVYYIAYDTVYMVNLYIVYEIGDELCDVVYDVTYDTSYTIYPYSVYDFACNIVYDTVS